MHPSTLLLAVSASLLSIAAAAPIVLPPGVSANFPPAIIPRDSTPPEADIIWGAGWKRAPPKADSYMGGPTWKRAPGGPEEDTNPLSGPTWRRADAEADVEGPKSDWLPWGPNWKKTDSGPIENVD